jgi:hypothetical protein
MNVTKLAFSMALITSLAIVGFTPKPKSAKDYFPPPERLLSLMTPQLCVDSAEVVETDLPKGTIAQHESGNGIGNPKILLDKNHLEIYRIHLIESGLSKEEVENLIAIVDDHEILHGCQVIGLYLSFGGIKPGGISGITNLNILRNSTVVGGEIEEDTSISDGITQLTAFLLQMKGKSSFSQLNVDDIDSLKNYSESQEHSYNGFGSYSSQVQLLLKVYNSEELLQVINLYHVVYLDDRNNPEQLLKIWKILLKGHELNDLASTGSESGKTYLDLISEIMQSLLAEKVYLDDINPLSEQQNIIINNAARKFNLVLS